MHSIKLNVDDSIYGHIMFLLKNLNTKELEIIEDKVIDQSIVEQEDVLETKAFSNHTANLIEDWKDSEEDEIWNIK